MSSSVTPDPPELAASGQGTGRSAEPLRLRVAVIAGDDPLAEESWSGTARSITEALQSVFENLYVERGSFPRLFHRLDHGLRKASGRRITIGSALWFVRIRTAMARRRIRAFAPDLVFVISASGLALLLAREFRVVMVDDAGPSMIEYYPDYAARPAFIKRLRKSVNRRAIRSAWLALYPSSWARHSAIHDAGKSPAEAVLIPWGNNMRHAPEARVRELGTPVRLLFVGKEWQRKGLPMLIMAVRRLLAEGFDLCLDVVGCDRPRDEPENPQIRFHGVLAKSDPQQGRQLALLYGEAHLLVVPSQAECLGMVFSEASAYGLPSISVRTGGIPTVVLDGQTGLLIEPGDHPDELAAAIRSLITDPQRYVALSRAALRDSEERLNWQVWARAVRKLVDQRLAAALPGTAQVV